MAQSLDSTGDDPQVQERGRDGVDADRGPNMPPIRCKRTPKNRGWHQPKKCQCNGLNGPLPSGNGYLSIPSLHGVVQSPRLDSMEYNCYKPSTVTSSRTEPADFCRAAFSSAVSL